MRFGMSRDAQRRFWDDYRNRLGKWHAHFALRYHVKDCFKGEVK